MTISQKDVLTTTPGKVLEVRVYYSKGGMSMFTYKQEPRGYYLAVTPMEITKGEGYTGRAFLMFGAGRKALLLEVKRQSPRAEKEALALASEKEREILEAVAKLDGLTLV